MILFWMAAIVLVSIVLLNVLVYAASRPYIQGEMADLEAAQAALVPGAAILPSGELSPILKERVDGAVDLYKNNKVSRVLVSGDNSSFSHDEVSPVRKYLIEKGVPEDAIFLDHAGFDTYSSMYRAQVIFGAESLIISSQSFHLPRSVFVARSLGISASGYRASAFRAPLKNYFREIFANEKAVIDLIIGRKPKFLGEPIPITGSGKET